MPDTENDKNRPFNERRTFLKAVGISSAALLVGGLSGWRYFVPKTRNLPVSSTYPTAILTDSNGNPIHASDIPVAGLSTSKYPLMVFNYPLQDEPNILMALNGVSIPGGVGPNSNIVAYSGICQHLACITPLLSYDPAKHIPFEAQLIGYTSANWPKYGLIYCKCHGSQYDPTKGVHNLYNNGPAPSPANHSLPQVILHHDVSTDYLYAVGMNSESPVIRTHQFLPNGEIYGSQVETENMSGRTELPIYSQTENVYKSIVVSSSNGPWPGNYY